MTFEIDLKYDVTVNGFKGKISVDQIRKKTIQEVKKEIKATYEEALKKNTDIYNLSEALYREDVKTWKKLQKDRKINLTSDTISKIDVHVNKVNPGRKTFDETINE